MAHLHDQQQVSIPRPYPFVFIVGDRLHHVRCLFVFLRFNKGDLQMSTESNAEGSTSVEDLGVKLESICHIQIVPVTLEQGAQQTDSNLSENSDLDDLDVSDDSDEPSMTFDIFSSLSNFLSKPKADLKEKTKTETKHTHREQKPSKKTDPSRSKTSHDTEKIRSHIPKVLNPVLIETAPINTGEITTGSISKLPCKAPVEPQVRAPLTKKTPLKQKLPSKKPAKIIEPSSITHYDSETVNCAIVESPPHYIEEVVIFEQTEDVFSNSPSALQLPDNFTPSEGQAKKPQSPKHNWLEAANIIAPNYKFEKSEDVVPQLPITNKKSFGTLNIARSNLKRQLQNQRDKTKQTHPTVGIENGSSSKLPMKTTSIFSDKKFEASILFDNRVQSAMEHVSSVHSAVVIETSPKQTVVTLEQIEDPISYSASAIPIFADIKPFVVQTPKKISLETSSNSRTNLQLSPIDRQLESLNLSDFDARVNLPLQDGVIRISPNTLTKRKVIVIPSTSDQHLNVESPKPKPKHSSTSAPEQPELPSSFEKNIISVMPAIDKVLLPTMQISSQQNELTHSKIVPLKCLGCSDFSNVGKFPEMIFNTDDCPECIELNKNRPPTAVQLSVSKGSQIPKNVHAVYPPSPQSAIDTPIVSNSSASKNRPYQLFTSTAVPSTQLPAPPLDHLELSPLQSPENIETSVFLQEHKKYLYPMSNNPTENDWEDILEAIGKDFAIGKDLLNLDESCEKLYSTNVDTATDFSMYKESSCSLSHCGKKGCNFCDRRKHKSFHQTEESRRIAEIERELLLSWPLEQNTSSCSDIKLTQRGRPSKKTAKANADNSSKRQPKPKKTKSAKQPASGDMLLKQILERSPQPLRKRPLPTPTAHSKFG